MAQHSHPPPPGFRGSVSKRLLTTLAAALAATLVAAPVAAQSQATITSRGLNGQGACPGGITATHIDDAGISHLMILNGGGSQAIQANPLGFISYSTLRGRVGDGSSTTSFPMRIRVTNTRTGSQVHDVAAGTIDSTNTATSMNLSLAVDPRTPYSVIYYANVTNLGPTRPESTSCFMTGGDYTITNRALSEGSNGCFTISPRTFLDVRNCLCGRPATGTMNSLFQGSDAWDYSSIQSNLGCDSS